MILSRFEALGLLPDSDVYKVYRLRNLKHGRAVYRQEEFQLEAIVELLRDARYLAAMSPVRGRGPVLILQGGSYLVRLDSNKLKKRKLTLRRYEITFS